MTDVAQYEGTTEIERPDLLDAETDSWVASVADVVRLASYICNTPFVPDGLRGSAPATAATILYGREIGVPPITALQTLHVIHGRVGMSAELMRARVLAAGHDLEVVESTGALCRMRGRRRGAETWTTVSWSIGDAKQAGLAGDNWRKYPRAMLTARCSAELCRLVFPDVTHGMAALEEMDDAPTPADGAPASSPRPVIRAARRAKSKRDAPEEPAPERPAPELPGTQDPSDGAPAATDPSDGAPALPVTTESFGGESPDPDAVVVEEEPPVDEDDPKAQAALRGDDPVTQPQTRHVMILLRKLGIGTTREERLHITQGLVVRRVESFNQLTISDASQIITTLLLALDSDEPRQFVRWVVDEGHRALDEREAELAAEADADLGIGDE